MAQRVQPSTQTVKLRMTDFLPRTTIWTDSLIDLVQFEWIKGIELSCNLHLGLLLSTLRLVLIVLLRLFLIVHLINLPMLFIYLI